VQDNLPRTKAVLKKVNIDTGKLAAFTRKKMGLGVLTGAVAVSSLGAGLGVAMSQHSSANAASRHRASQPARAVATARYSGKGTGGAKVMYDSVTPTAVPKDKVLATYIDGPYAQPQAAKDSPNPVVWIDTNGSAPAKAQVLDVEPGDATPASAATWAQTRLDHNPGAHTVIYTMTSQWDATKAALKAKLTSQQYTKVKWWIADPTGTKHDLKGADAVQWWWGGTGQNPAAIGQTHDINVDVSTVKPSFWTQ
jgi:hypothetical protein